VWFRSKHPNEATMKEVETKMQENNVDINHMVEMKANHCQ
jgi:hypothetical protein